MLPRGVAHDTPAIHSSSISFVLSVQVCDVQELQEVVENQLGALPNYKYKRENGKYRSYPHQYNATYFSACKESPRVRRRPGLFLATPPCDAVLKQDNATFEENRRPLAHD